MTRKNILLAVLLGSLVLSGTSMASVEAGRTEVQEYTVAVSVPNCPPSSMSAAVRCFGVEPGETILKISVVESSPTAGLGSGIAVRAKFPGTGWPAQDFCGNSEVWVPEGATKLVVEVRQGLVNGFCAPFAGNNLELSPATHGTISATFA